MKNLINIENRKGKLKLNDGVHKESADQLIEELEQLYGGSAVASNMQIGDITCSADNALESVNVEINSPGGSVMEGQRIYNALRGISSRGVEVVTTVNGLAASMGSVILMAGDVRKMTQGSRVMIHEASTMTWGDAHQLRSQANLLEGISAELAGIYAERSDGDADEIRELMKNETWMSAEEAKNIGFVNSIIKNGKEEADAENSLLTLDSPSSAIESQTKSPMPIFKSKSDYKAEVESLTAQLESAEGENETQAEQIQTLQAEIVTKDESIATSTANIATVTASNTELSEQVSTLTADLATAKSETEEAEASTAAKATEIAASAGHEAVEAETEDDAKNSPEGLHAQYRELKATNPAAATKFWNENKAAMLEKK